MEELEDWEEWDPTGSTSFLVHAAAGSLAGAAEHCLMFPLDTIKTHYQAAHSSKTRLGVSGKSDFNLRQLPRFWRGVSTTLTACIPAHAAYFSIYEYSKLQVSNYKDTYPLITSGFCGVFSTLAHDFIMTPLDVVKQRLQLGFYQGPIHCIRTILNTEGTRALYLSLPTTLMMNIPYAVVMMATNDYMKQLLNPSNDYNVQSYFISGAAAGATAAIITNPLDVVKTRLQTQDLLNSYPRCNNLLDSTTSTIRANGSSSQTSNLFRKPLEMQNFFRQSSLFGTLKLSRDTPKNVNVGLRYTYTVADGHPLKTRKELECLCEGSRNMEKGNFPQPSNRKYHNFFETARKIFEEDKFRGFSKGAGYRALLHAPSVAISWTTYESAKHIFKQV